jgi:hypothetical protein
MSLSRAPVSPILLAADPDVFRLPEDASASDRTIVISDVMHVGETDETRAYFFKGEYHRCKACASFSVRLCRRCSCEYRDRSEAVRQNE